MKIFQIVLYLFWFLRERCGKGSVYYRMLQICCVYNIYEIFVLSYKYLNIFIFKGSLKVIFYVSMRNMLKFIFVLVMKKIIDVIVYGIFIFYVLKMWDQKGGCDIIEY